MKVKLYDSIQSYLKLIPGVYIILIIIRLVETALILFNYSDKAHVIPNELIGLGYDIIAASAFMALLFPIYSIVYTISSKLAAGLFKLSTYIVVIASFIILKYFTYQLIPLDIFLYNYSVQEVLFTIKTSDTSITKNIMMVLAILISVFFSFIIGRKVKIPTITIATTVVSLILFFVLFAKMTDKTNKFAINKTLYFAKQSCKYKFKTPEVKVVNNYQTFHDMYPNKSFINKDYPLIHKQNRNSKLAKYFTKGNTSPNIVILIVEGLNDDYIHEYKGVILMPFLNELKNKSLYWNRCFTLGERSFAAVPSILGGLPYGEKGFTLLNSLPKHTSMVSVLKANDYYTTFFYGQGAWFHQKNRFFNHNNIDLVFDNSKFHKKYDKIIVGDDNFFWGYNDKDLFNQSLEVIDTIPQKRLDIYFTGTSHSPFVIKNDALYYRKLKQITPPNEKEFFNTYSKYLKSVLFVDDALKEFFAKYSKRDDYKNTIFIITGDHPMSEIPITNSLKRYHVPLIIFSENITEPQKFQNTVSHLDISESIYSILEEYDNKLPNVSASLGNNLIPNKKVQYNYAFMNDNREVIDFYSNGYYLANDVLYKTESLLDITEVKNDSIKADMKSKLETFKNASLQTSVNDKIIPATVYCKSIGHSIVFSSHISDTLNIKSEYHNLTENTEILNSDFTLDIRLKVNKPAEKEAYVVYQLTNSSDSVLLWNNFGISGDNTQPQIHINIDKASTEDSSLFFKSFIWNKYKSEFNVSEVDILLHSKE